MTEAPRLPGSAPPTQPGQADPRPTASAQVSITTRPVQLKAKTDGVPPGDTRTLIAACSMVLLGLGTLTWAGIVMYLATPGAIGWYLGLALAELAFALVVIILVARLDRTGQVPGLARKGRRKRRGATRPRRRPA
jgi:hypothetical protein